MKCQCKCRSTLEGPPKIDPTNILARIMAKETPIAGPGGKRALEAMETKQLISSLQTKLTAAEERVQELELELLSVKPLFTRRQLIEQNADQAAQIEELKKEICLLSKKDIHE
jgi:hypothetical protein